MGHVVLASLTRVSEAYLFIQISKHSYLNQCSTCILYAYLMEKFIEQQEPAEIISHKNEKIRLSNKILAKLLVWGVIACNPLQAAETNAHTHEIDNGQTIEQGENEKAISLESRFKEAGLLSLEQNHPKPVIVITTKESLDANYSEDSGILKTQRSFLSEQLVLDLFKGETVDIVERGSDALGAILKEAKLGEEGLVKDKERVKLGYWQSADYYVVPSIEKKGEAFVYINEIINMKDGSSISVQTESPNEHSETSVAELSKKTEEAIQSIESQKHGSEK